MDTNYKMKKKESKIINEIEKARRNNNKNWMNIMKLAITYAPKKSKLLIKKINIQDKKISRLLSKIK